VTLKGGFINFRLDSEPPTIATFLSSVNGLRANNVSGVLYPGGGLQGHLGALGLRLDIGDEMYFNHGTHHNLGVAFGPSFSSEDSPLQPGRSIIRSCGCGFYAAAQPREGSRRHARATFPGGPR
jgi:hypothetical protein